jgi:phosphoribosylformylglycinamidine synthase
MVDRLDGPPPGVRFVDGAALLAIGPESRSLSGSRWAWERGHRAGSPPALDLDGHLRVAALVRDLVVAGLVEGIHDTADGIGVALAEMAVRSGVGCAVEAPSADHRWLLAESPSRAVACVAAEHVDEVLEAARSAGVPAGPLGVAAGQRIAVAGLLDVSVSHATTAWRGRLPEAMGAGATH